MSPLFRAWGPRQGRPASSLALAVFLCACVGSGEGVPIPEADPGAVPRSFAEIQSMIFDPICALRCHRGGSARRGLSLESGRSIRALVGVASSEVSGMLLVAPGRPEESYLIVKVATFDPRRVGSRMPRTGPPFLSGRQVAALKRWIGAGAKQDWIDEGPSPTVPDAGGMRADLPAADLDPADAGAEPLEEE